MVTGKPIADIFKVAVEKVWFAAVVTPFDFEGNRNLRADAVVDRPRRDADLVMAYSNEGGSIATVAMPR
ncbi:MAG: hypothetical protein IPG52_12315 [Rhodocyclaceae bacterium]|nr:hypothetical protein [Rhodocyclaceae bacterium]